jgi:mono/diheme cytochrome c family protein
MKKLVYTTLSGAVLTMSLLLNSCVSNADSPGLEYAPDMYRTPGIETYVDYGEVRGRENKAWKGRLTALTPPRNTIPFYGTDSTEVKLMLPYFRKPNIAFRETHGLYGWDYSTADEYTLAAADKNQLLINAANAETIITKGKELFTAMCQHCHGEKGDGNGPMVASGAYAGVPNYVGLAATEGQMFYSIYYGKGMMGAHGSILNKKEIWSIVHYIRRLQDANYGKFDANGVAMSTTVSDTTKAN